jgi:hypothetical protein
MHEHDVDRKNWTKEQWRQHNREMQEQCAWIQDHGKREKLESDIKALLAVNKLIQSRISQIEISIYDLELEGNRCRSDIVKNEKGIELLQRDLHVITIGVAKWRRTQEALIQMEDRED